ncbi:MAG TPA: LytR C-terminal domain-containing protein [Ignavibacteriales bacterium]|nr:LytR C-terminal domain-containing protein [Ignavibacteriales bacterium]HOL80672.1 LytR C-terminal domain-containing protein [Ignavibacteriales bacterium]HOM64360.1 LytR C-terminal domain-containing protein [Ignavibacteriales bacterium]HPD67148.1 LytR C-terminal domain-containing protein [Ignavibacteriales bacterium]HPP32995.1 LytR C-terminal domain-containing protein [Ignavibacteriales bacterium]
MSNNTNNINNNVPQKAVLTNFFYNFLLVILFFIIIFLVYSIIVKFTKDDNISEITINNQGLPSEIIQVEVLNASDIAGVAERVTDFLRNSKVDVVNISNYHIKDIPYTLVIDRRGNMANAYQIAKILNVSEKNVISQINNDYLVDVTIIIGRDYNKLKPFITK